MTNKERLYAAFNNRPVDTVPVGFWFHYLTEDQVDGALENPDLAQKSIEGHRKFIESFRPDFVKIMSDGYFHYPIGKGETYRTPEDLDKITLINENHPWIARQVELAKAITSIDRDIAYFYNFFSPLNNLQWLVGPDAFYRLFQENPQQVAKALDTISQGLVLLATALIRKGGADGVYFSVSNPDQSRISDEAYTQYISPSERKFLEQVEKVSANNILHICGFKGKRNNLFLYQNYPAKAINWAVNVEGVSLAQGKKIFGNRAVIGGYPNSPGSLIHTGSQTEIQDFARDLLRESGSIGVAVGADCTIPSDTDWSHLEWVRQAVRSKEAVA